MSTDLTPYRATDLGQVGEPVVFHTDEAHHLVADDNLTAFTYAEVHAMATTEHTAMLQRADLVEQPTGPVDLPDPDTKPTTGDKVDLIGSLTVLSGALTGLAFNAGTSPQLVIYPVSASIAAMGIAAVVHLRGLPKVAR